VQEQIDTGRPGFWELAVQMQLAAIAGDWPTAERAAHDALAQAPASWMVRSAVRELGAIEEKTHDAAAQMHLSKLADLLSAPVDRAEADDD
jgi:hypothetical protein